MKFLRYLNKNWFYILIIITLYCISMYFSFQEHNISLKSFAYTIVTNKDNKDTSSLRQKKGNSEAKSTEPIITSYETYMKDLETKIKKNWTPPELNKSTYATITFDIHKNGNISNLAIKQSSNIKSFDVSAIEAIKKSKTFKPLPKFEKNNKVTIHAYTSESL